MSEQTFSRADMVAFAEKEAATAEHYAKRNEGDEDGPYWREKADIYAAIAAALEQGERDKDDAHNVRVALKVANRACELFRQKAERMEQALRTAKAIAHEALAAWDADKDSRVGKLLRALAGHLPGYRADIDAIHAALAPSPTGEVKP